MTAKKSKLSPLYYLPVLILVIVAVFQLAMSNFSDLSPWKGGGFGMFSSLKNPGMRRVHVRLNFADGQEKLVSSKQFSKMAVYDQLRSFPKETKLLEFLEEIKLLKWKHRHGDSDEYLRINSLGQSAVEIEVEINELIYEKGRVRAEKILSHKWRAK